MKGNRPSSTRFLVLVVAALVVGAVVLGLIATRPDKGNGLEKVTLTPVPGSYSRDLRAKLEDAAAVIRLRLAALDKRVIVDIVKNRLEVQAPPLVAAQLTRIGSPGQLELRPVLALHEALSCPESTADPTATVSATVTLCSQDRLTSYDLGPVRLSGLTSVSGATTTDLGSNRQVQIQLTATGRRLFTALTRELSKNPLPRNQLAIVLDDVVISAPEVHGTITGDTQISGEFTREQAQALAATIRYGGLPLAFAISEG